MLRIKDRDQKTKFILRDEDDEPIKVDELIIKEAKKNNGEKDGEDKSH